MEVLKGFVSARASQDGIETLEDDLRVTSLESKRDVSSEV